MKQTAVNYLFQELWNTPKDKLEWNAIFDKAKEIEIQQIKEATINGILLNEKARSI